ncbi:nickel pincer cofactor biosynthesis protein LarB [Methanothermococcus okinawensis]|uniref:1-(5-phosphoribosyl)-5-amino-4-imidazole-carboxylate (AIR) carboxylase n=1 Tax=Methanothermococcus okinawensis (strain DSM 14208 / JCM 11175 / IH1) TaxID=647113 RepID=F8AKP8_METOI|nr:nickel pincer cofactor biosynthesis protein LarB [Methanothermococcus okinawensis]AEH06381.1 1-(5-phosphoribosyl)-5-amino-4-imidazole-carboxylate (AIR) carboxylase [Methanothermococcus okinawensis IH1]
MREILTKFRNGELSLNEAEKKLKLFYLDEVEKLYNLDFNRKNRTGVPEVVYGKGKETEDIANILFKLAEDNGTALATRVNDIEGVMKSLNNIKDIDKYYNIGINNIAKTIALTKKNYKIKSIGKIGIITAGTSDIPVAEEAKEAAKIMGCDVLTAYDVGIAGIHRITKPLKKMVDEDVYCIIVIAGMEGALPSVVSSLVDVPVIGVPTSTGYGIKETPLLTMLHSCTPGLAVVNMDNGFGAGIFAGLIGYNIYKRLNIQ